MASSPRPFDLGDLHSLPLVHLVSAGEPLRVGQVHRAWRGMVQTPGSVEMSIPVVLKYLPEQPKLAIELACSLASAVFKLRVPRGMLVLADRTLLPGLPADALSVNERGEVLCFASALRWPDDTAERALEGDPAVTDYLWHRFCSTNDAAPTAAWDELVANPDRHTGNFIYDGVRYWLIDHELSLKPLADSIRRMAEAAVRQAVIEHKAERNQVAAQLVERRPDDHGILDQVQPFESKKRALQGLEVTMRTWKTGSMTIDGVLELAYVVMGGIILRLPPLGLQLTERLAKPGGSLQWTTSEG